MRSIQATLLCAALLLTACSDSRRSAQNPDPNHTHTDFAVIIRGEQFDFSADEYMSGLDEDDHDHEHKHDYLHLHDNIGHVVHRHKPGLAIGEFFESLGHKMLLDCFMDFCSNQDERWVMSVNRSETKEPVWERMDLDPLYEFNDLDQILFTYGATDEEIASYIEQMTDDSCLYSRTCPQRGDPPEENCIADPAVPCVVPLDDL